MWVLIVVGVFILFCYKLIRINKHWENKGVPFVKPWPIFGNFASNAFRTRAMPHILEDLYKAYPNERYVGIYQFVNPIFMLRDPELIKKITVREFETFPNHTIFGSKDADHIASKSLFNLNSGDGWHEMRATLSPTFTSSKMRTMFTLMEQCAENFTNHFLKKDDSMTIINLKETLTRYSNDVIGSTAFGVTCDSLENPENEFYVMGKELTSFSGLRGFIFLGFAISPKLMKLLNVSFFSEKVETFFRSLIDQSLYIRKEKQIIRPDMIRLLMEAKNSSATENEDSSADVGFAAVQESEIGRSHQKIAVTNEDIVAQALGFFFGGFDTSSDFLCFATYELAINPDIQKRLLREIESVSDNHKGKITYEALQEMKYLDCVVSETLRKWPPVMATDRKSVRPYTLEPEQVHLEKGTVCWIPIYPIHRDPQYYPDPEKFDPERFNDENKHQIRPFTYLPFGAGPRNCIGSRFALLEGKLLIAKIVQKFELVRTDKTPVPIEYSLKNINFLPDSGLWVGLRPRQAAP